MNSTNVNAPLHFSGERLSHAYIVADGFADTLAMAAVCSGSNKTKPCMNCAHCDKASRHIHPDIMVVDRLPDKREITIDQVRALKRDVVIVPNEADKKVYIVNNADSMNINAQNAFLQILEEPPPHTVFVLKTENPVALLPTVRSRCIELKARHESVATDAVAAEMSDKFFSALEHGNASLMEIMFALEKLDKNEFSAFLSATREQTAARLKLSASGNTGIPCAKLAQAERILVRAGEMFDLNVSSGHITGMICADLMEIEN